MILTRLKQWLHSKTAPHSVPVSELEEWMATTHFKVPINARQTTEAFLKRTFQRSASQDTIAGAKDMAMDSNSLGTPFSQANTVIPQSLIQWYGLQSYIGQQMPAIFAQHWLIDKCCKMPAEDAIAKGYKTTINDGIDIDPKVLDDIRSADVKFNINAHMVDLVHKCNIFGIRIAIFRVESDDPDYYEKPFNIDGVKPGSYKGVAQVDPYWITPELDFDASANPASAYFYEPTWWRVNGVRYHRTHLIVIRTGNLPNILKPTYFYGGIPLPQQLYERVYCAERTANEAPQLALTKRTKVIYTNIAKVLMNQAKFEDRMRVQAYMRDNYAAEILDTSEKTEQFDTSLSDLEEVIISQFQIVAMISEIPANKLLSTSPKGFGSTGEYEDNSYNQKLQSIQTHKLTPFLERHHMLLIKSEIGPKYGIELFDTSVVWEALVSPSVADLATINKTKADTDLILLQAGAIDGEDIRNRLIADPASGYNTLEDENVSSDPNTAPIDLSELDDPELEGNIRNLETVYL